MTDRMHDEQLDRELRSFLAWQAEEIGDAPTATEIAARISSTVGTRTASSRLVPQLAWVVLAGLLLAALLGAMAVGALLQRAPSLPPSYEAVFLRLEVAGLSPEVRVVGVDKEGREREIARLPGAWAAYNIQATETEQGFLAPMGAVSPSGLLAMPSSRGEAVGRLPLMQWEIFDLHRPQAEPIVIPGISQDLEQLRSTPSFGKGVDSRGGVFWGPGERLAIAWYVRVADPPDSSSSHIDRHLSFVQGRTGAATAVDIADDEVLLASWASDGSGVFLGGDGGNADPERILRPDGTEADANGAVETRTCRMPVGQAGCRAPDDSMIVEFRSGTPASRPSAALLEPESGARFEIEGNFAGWLEVVP